MSGEDAECRGGRNKCRQPKGVGDCGKRYLCGEGIVREMASFFTEPVRNIPRQASAESRRRERRIATERNSCRCCMKAGEIGKNQTYGGWG